MIQTCKLNGKKRKNSLLSKKKWKKVLFDQLHCMFLNRWAAALWWTAELRRLFSFYKNQVKKSLPYQLQKHLETTKKVNISSIKGLKLAK
jgi:hypothetical protein